MVLALALALGAILLLMWLVMAAPVGVRTVRVRVPVDAPRDAVWQMLYPFGRDAGWNQALVSVKAHPDDPHHGHMVTAHTGRDGQPIERDFLVEDCVEGERFRLRYTSDTSLDQSFWADHFMTVTIAGDGDRARMVEIAETDRYKGAAFLVFRYFSLRRIAGKIPVWLKTGTFRKGGLFEKPATQFGMAVLSALLLWPIFGLDAKGLFLSATLTAVVALHEYGHVLAFRTMGHKGARMIFIPILGGMAMGGRPYDRKFEVGFSALMGAGFSAFPVAVLTLAFAVGAFDDDPARRAGLVVALLIAALFNLGNLVPVWKFDGGQVVRQIMQTRAGEAVAASVILFGFIMAGIVAGISPAIMVIGGAVLAILSVMTSGTGVKPKRPLTPMTGFERVALAGAFAAVFAIHAAGLVTSLRVMA